MLTKWGLTNFKSIYDAEVELAPLTILTGTNSSGKSSFIQSMLVISQTVQNKISSRGLVLNGPLIKMGTFEDVLSFDGQSSGAAKNNIRFDIGISYDYKAQENAESLFTTLGKNIHNAMNILMEKISREKPPEGFGIFEASADVITNVNCGLLFTHKKDRFDPVVQESKLEFDYKDNENNVHNAAITVSPLFAEKYKITKISGIDKELFYNFKGSVDFVSLNHFLPAALTGFSYAEAYDKTMEPFYNLFSNMIVKMTENIDGIKTDDKARQAAVDEYLAQQTQKMPQKITKKDERVQEMKSALLTKANEFIENYFENKFLYLGPLRFREPVSPVSILSNPKDVGLSGEYTAQVIYYFKDEKVKYIPVENGALASGDPQEDTLNAALEHWLDYIGVVQKVSVEPLGQAGFRLGVARQKRGNKLLNMTQVGTGVSQVLPILVMCLLAEPDSTLVFEQPELHLHPNMQVKLADFFLSMALLGKQCIVETHSEHIINQICYRYASEKNDAPLQDKTKIYFCENQGGALAFNGITVNKYGSLSQWPKDFFDTAQILTDKIIDAASKKIEAEEEGETGND